MKVIQELVAHFDRQGQLTQKQLKRLLDQGMLAAEAPPTIADLCDAIGATYYFRVTGVADGPLWGSDIYTGDSLLAAAAVHAGALKIGETGIVKVTVETPLQAYVGEVRNGVTSHGFGSYGSAYRIERV